MFITLNLRWLIHLKDGELRSVGTEKNSQPRAGLATLLHWCKRST